MAHKTLSRKKSRKSKASGTLQATAPRVVSAGQFPHFHLPYRGLPPEVRLEIWKYLFPVEVRLCIHPSQSPEKYIKTVDQNGKKARFGIYSRAHRGTNFGSDYLLVNRETHQEVKAAMRGGYLFFNVRPWNAINAIYFVEAIPKEVYTKISHFAIPHMILGGPSMFASHCKLPTTATLIIYAEMYSGEHLDMDHYSDAQTEPLVMLMDKKVAELQIEFTIEEEEDLNVYDDWKFFVDTLDNFEDENVPLRSWCIKKKDNGKEMTLFVRRAN